jgi:hypothetical protein
MKKFVLLICIILLAMMCGSANALVIPQNLSSLVLGSDIIVYGKIVSVEGMWDAQHTHIETRAQVQTSEILKKPEGMTVPERGSITVTVPGGTVGNQTDWVEDTPVFSNGTEAFMFLKKTSTESYTLYAQGYYPTSNGPVLPSEPGKMSTSAGDISAFRQQVIAILQKNGGPVVTASPIPTITPSPVTNPTTKQAPFLCAPAFLLILALMFFRKLPD